MKRIKAKEIGEKIESLCLEISTSLSDDVIRALKQALEREKSKKGRKVLEMILENAKSAGELGVPICQDTGIFTIFLDLEPDVCIEGDIYSEASSAVSQATKIGALRPSVVSPPIDERRNTWDNTPPLLITGFTSGNSLLSVMAKGGGSEMASRMAMLKPGSGWPGVVKFIMDVLDEVAPRACPPLFLGVGIGGSFERACELSKRALLLPVDRLSEDERIAERERELIKLSNDLGFGPGGLGGTITCAGARIIEDACHMASLPVALNVCCHALRRKTIVL